MEERAQGRWPPERGIPPSIDERLGDEPDSEKAALYFEGLRTI